MTSLLNRLSLCLFVLRIFVTVIHGEFMGLPPNGSLRSLAEEETVLPCRYQPSESGVVVVQVTWYKETEQIITAHHINGQTAFGTWSRRVRFRSSEPTVDSSLVIMSTDISDEGKYICRISTFPSGNFDSEMSLIVWTVPISSIDPVILVEGQSYRQAASCRSIGRPPPRLTWDTDLNGQFTSRSSDNGAVSTQYSLHPLRSMNGKKLDCLVWHETSSTPRRLSNRLVVHFPPHAEVSGYNEDWSIGMENAALRCLSGGNPKPQSFTWIRKGGQLPEGVIAHPNGTLAFGRPLNSTDKGIYECEAKNEVGVGKAEVEIVVTDSLGDHDVPENMLMLIVLVVSVGLLILMIVIVITVTCHHKRKNLKLEKELTERKEEITTLSRQASFRRMNSVSTDTRGATEENIPLRVEGTLRTSLSSLGEQTHCRDSRSTISGGRGGGGGAFDYLGRPVLHNNSRRGRERLLDRDEDTRLRVETYVRNSTMSLQETRFHPPLTPSAFPMVQSTEVVRQLNGSASIPTDGGSRPGSVAKNHQHPPMSCNYPPVTDDEDEVDEGLGGPASQEHPDDQYSETNSSQVSEAHSTRYQQTNGTLRPKPRPSPTMISPHASLIHKAQIV
ncbi:nectin-4-like isoform X1 [Seriola dumerili]|uniref:nectin-4-like isoform X1 n=1 Tax=Seriola dumerili TaxID=41447 RepID=UPI000BBF0374|nr:nectin-4-like isoform X1 [Seriola dumerili]